MKHILLIIVSIAFFSPFVLTAQTKSEKQIASFLEEYNISDTSQIGISIAVFKSDTIAMLKSFGFENIERKKKFTEESIVGLGSLTKTYTAVAILQLIDKGEIAYETKIGTIIEDLPAYAKEISIRNLLEHKSGLPNLITPERLKEKFVFDYKLLPTLFQEHDKLVFDPGTKSSYNQLDYGLLALVIENVSRKSYEKYMSKYIFKKIKVKNTFVRDFSTNTFGSAVPVYFTNSEGEIQKVKDFKEHLPLGFSGIYASQRDFLTFLEAVHTGKLLDEKHKTEGFLKPYFSNLSGAELPRFSFSGVNKEVYSISHKFLGGADAGYSSIMLRVPYDNTSVLIFTNHAGLFDMYRMAKLVSNAYSKVFIVIEPRNNNKLTPAR